MTIEVKIEGGAHLLEQVAAAAVAEGQPLNELEQRCLQSALTDPTHTGLEQIEREFPSPQAYNEFMVRARGLMQRALLQDIESRPELTPQARASLEKFMGRGGDAVVGAFLSLALFGRVPPAVRAFGTVVTFLVLAFLCWQFYPLLTASRSFFSDRFFVQAVLTLALVAAVSSVFRFLKKLSGK